MEVVKLESCRFEPFFAQPPLASLKIHQPLLHDGLDVELDAKCDVRTAHTVFAAPETQLDAEGPTILQAEDETVSKEKICSRDVAIGPVVVVSLLLGTMLQNEIDPKNKHNYQRLAFTATFFAGVAQFALGFFRLGFLIEFLSHAAIIGSMRGVAVTKQLKGLFGINDFKKKIDIVSAMRSIINLAQILTV
ncbi:sulfate transporter 1 [Artemisia annua]|uniref:Sulfate transporter 1 n=1 Tax=Artemisia annua TaxID=35608 RepID=A0A2U1MJE2_ARTAN|nr:sulfate transporter 1 [Artemisia annua]